MCLDSLRRQTSLNQRVLTKFSVLAVKLSLHFGLQAATVVALFKDYSLNLIDVWIHRLSQNTFLQLINDHTYYYDMVGLAGS